MNKKKINLLLLVFSIVIIIVLLYVITNQNKQIKTTLSDTDLVDFAIEDTSSIDKIILRPYNGNPYILTKEISGEWVGENGICIEQSPVINILEAIKNIKIKGFPSQDGQDAIKNDMTLNGIRCEIFQNGKLSKTWIIGSSTQDHYGCYMLLEKNNKQSPKVVITEMMDFHGTLNTRFYINPLKWSCTNLFSYKPNEIKKIEIVNNQKNKKSFEIEVLDKNKFDVTSLGQSVKFDTNEVRNYILRYTKIHFENQTVELNTKEKDSLRKIKPFSRIKITTKEGKEKIVNCYRKKPYKGKDRDLEGNKLEFDQERFWIDLGDGDKFAKSQFFVFDPLFNGYRTIIKA